MTSKVDNPLSFQNQLPPPIVSSSERTKKVSFKQVKNNKSNKIYEKINELIKRYLTTKYLSLKAGQAIKAKILPLSNPAGWDEKMKQAKKRVFILKTLIESRKQLLNQLHQKLKTASPSSKTHLQETEAKLKYQYQKFNKNLNNARKHVEYLEKQRFSQVSSRFNGYIGMASNLILPGSGTLISVALTSASAVTQENLVELLPEDEKVKSLEKYNARLGTFITVASTVASIAFSLLIAPIIKETLFNNQNG